MLGRSGTLPQPAADSTGEVLESALIAIVLVFLIIRPYVVQAFYIPSGSMHPTLLERDRILVNKFVYRFREPKRGDVVVFKAPSQASPDGREKDFIKRVVGLPGDTLEVRDGATYINGKPLREPYIEEPPYYVYPPYQIPQGMLFVMGDNRNDSNDSHSWGPLERSRILGKALVVFWPFSRAGLIH
ncbi:MAG: signal peptidase I [Armatimonadetes bacterium]|nr:signal peptidase I [Armatimonadota bacterium]